jgi:ectoine hydroxylase-related dioxygenase (phytanoyl-CoA dioxygenase family)
MQKLNVELTLKELESEGFLVVEDFLTTDELNNLKKICEARLLTQPEKEGYTFGKALRLNPPTQDVLPYFYNENFSEIATRFGAQSRPEAVFITHDYKNDVEELSRNGWWHIDRYFFLKYFYYLTDVKSTDDGAFSVCPKSHIDGKKLRAGSWGKTNNYGEVKNRIELDFPEYMEKYEKKPIIGPAGTLIIFSTNTFHIGGQTTKGGSRLIARGHYRANE